MDPKISILIPAYNVENYVEECLLSLFDNKLINECEIIIINDCSTDNTLYIIEKLKNENQNLSINIINHEVNRGIGSTRNELLSLVKGKYFLFCDSDDWVEPDYLEKLYHAAEENNAEITGCNINIYSGNSVLKREIPLKETGYQCIIEWGNGKLPSWLFLKLIRTDFIKQNNIKFIDGINFGEDALFMTKSFSKVNKMAYVNEYLYNYRKNTSSITGSLFNETKCENLIESQRLIEDLLIQTYPNEQSILRASYLSKILKKRWILFKGNKNCQKKYMNLWPEINPVVNESNNILPVKIVLKNKPHLLAVFLLEIFNIYKKLK